MAVIETQNLTKRYSAAPWGQPTLAVDEITFSVERGQVFGFLGPNGSGKTTTIGMLLGIITPTGGVFRLFGKHGPRDILAARQRIGATLEHPNFYPYLSCRDNLRLVARVKGKGSRAVDEALEVVGLADRRKTKFRACSLGMKQRLAIGATLLGDPELIVLDEPANGLDPAGQREIRDVIRRLAERGKTIFLSSHILHDVERMCTHVAIIARGRIVKTSSVPALTAHGTRVVLKAEVDTERLAQAVRAFNGTRSAEAIGDRVVADLDPAEMAALNEHLMKHGILLHHLAVEHQTLESVFMSLTGGADGFGAVA
jgi:ABC-type multidrug transport system ATPase subunit